MRGNLIVLTMTITALVFIYGCSNNHNEGRRGQGAMGQRGGQRGGQMGQRGGQMGGQHMARKHTAADVPLDRYITKRLSYVGENGLPQEFVQMKSPSGPTDELMARGKEIFGSRCAMCHGDKGHGDGPAGKALKPPPSDIARIVAVPIVREGYLYWAVSEGGAKFATQMPPFKSTLTEEEIWSVIQYIKTFSPRSGASGGPVG